ncbi:hypothetical protein E1B28_006299 [Marasmius oreades]|uniref:Hikeshi-like domain-containing protein n=1 Tax=Marasmius oreades TaxID=181124 RepID=A0A9P7S7W3_9AGAR|nr:uncharacterized protein E1B28_006299 [Marasmius oreades]KAG7095563.1 hypothetical protein E1B28_006299 [Marasmius oreades]
MFGCCVAGRLFQTNLQQVDETHALFELPDASTINHVCVFLLGTTPFPDGYGATVHFHWPGKGFQLLGMLSNEKPSAIFRLRGTFSSSTSYSAFDSMDTSTQDSSMSPSVTAMLGISIETLQQIQPQMDALQSVTTVAKPSPASNPILLAEKIVRHLFNYVAGFSGGLPGSKTSVSMSVIAKWYENFTTKIKTTGIGFLEREE